MATLLFNNTHTFRSEIKKAVVQFVLSEYNLCPPERIEGMMEGIQWVKDKATQLLESAQFLHGATDLCGKASNFVHPTLRKSCLAIYYGNGSKCLYCFVEFQSSMPKEALLLITAIVQSVLTTYKLHGENKPVPLQVDEVKAVYYQLENLMDQIVQNKYHSKKLRKMLAGWVKTGM
ncbi:hypothetical protein HD554DRAFT_2169371 [Boletus coccyginus]|nr:hypothetical protein HD554DRAFT_2169371 [Boletus coccyginus]